MRNPRKRPVTVMTFDPDVKRKLQYICQNTPFKPTFSRLMEQLAIDYIDSWEDRNGAITDDMLREPDPE